MAARRLNNPLALAVLTLLVERPMHPYEMSSTLKERSKQESIKLNYGSLYSVIESLLKRGLIEVQQTTREGKRPERTVYAVTDEGRDVMVDWLSELLSTPAKEFPQFEAGLSLMPALGVDQAIALLERRLDQLRRQHEVGRRMLRQASELGLPRLFSIEHEYELALQTAEIEFVDELLDELKSGAFPGVQIWRRIHELRSTGLSMDEVDARIRDEFAEEYPWLDEQ
ncbi:PadR family transcriptional regulator [Phytoactinopolyspora halotolerans]|uniref:PadR family transcriptional regulator n=1 Tax=Phytoactinopolyspora halotolerans TaxID=1981512 RepID=A0A6L9S2K4_9ACTN|nr:PadR family transcriptional regulator [Phytoactinopolyspora halotolerans]NED99445.1 PadR family transcriptional regulator [Phytoactinopolyspora halotolerans]